MSDLKIEGEPRKQVSISYKEIEKIMENQEQYRAAKAEEKEKQHRRKMDKLIKEMGDV